MPTALSLPVFASPVSAGFPSPCEDFYERSLDLNTYLVPRPATTFFMRVARDMTLPGYTLHTGAIVVIDRSLSPTPSHMVVMMSEGTFKLKRLSTLALRHRKEGDGEAFDERGIWGVVTAIIQPV